jgi:hypothetical protein
MDNYCLQHKVGKMVGKIYSYKISPVKRILFILLIGLGLLISCNFINFNNVEGRANKLRDELSKFSQNEEIDLFRIGRIAFQVESCEELEPLWDSILRGELHGDRSKGASFYVKSYLLVRENLITDTKIKCTHKVHHSLDGTTDLTFHIKRTKEKIEITMDETNPKDFFSMD